MISLIEGYSFLFIFNPYIVRMIFRINPFECTRGFANIQSFNDLMHTCVVLTPMVMTGNSKMVPISCFVYFFLDVLFNFRVFIKNKSYFIHHLFGCFQVYLVYRYFMDNVETLGFFIWVQETALIPITFIDILRMKSLKTPISLYFLRALWYFFTRVYTYGFFFYNYYRIFGGYPLINLMTIPLIVHNTNVFRLQIKSIIRLLC
jgi:hypothetical protein